jgi:uncharacterized protein
MLKEIDFEVLSRAFGPSEAIARDLLPHALPSDDGSHDATHLVRVWRNVIAISAKEGGDSDILAAATILHDCFAVEKSSPLRSQASKLASDKARQILRLRRWSASEIERVTHAIEAHSFSAGIPPHTIEAKILQDADRLDAIGAIGIARCFYVAGRLNRPLYDLGDARGTRRKIDDNVFAVDHFEAKLFGLAATFVTQAGADMAKERNHLMRRYMEDFFSEVEGKPDIGARPI